MRSPQLLRLDRSPVHVVCAYRFDQLGGPAALQYGEDRLVFGVTRLFLGLIGRVQGVLRVIGAKELRETAEFVLANPPWPTGWEDWQPTPGWQVPNLPPGWDELVD